MLFYLYCPVVRLINGEHLAWDLASFALPQLCTLLHFIIFVLVYISYVQYCVAICMRAK